MPRIPQDRQYYLALMMGATGINLGTFLLQTQYLLWGDWTHDQGLYFLVALMMNNGFAPYTDLNTPLL